MNIWNWSNKFHIIFVLHFSSGRRASFKMFTTVSTIVCFVAFGEWIQQQQDPEQRHSSTHCCFRGSVLPASREKLNMTKNAPNMACCKRMASDSWQQRSWEIKPNSPSAVPLAPRRHGEQMTQFESDRTGFRAQIQSSNQTVPLTDLLGKQSRGVYTNNKVIKASNCVSLA